MPPDPVTGNGSIQFGSNSDQLRFTLLISPKLVFINHLLCTVLFWHPRGEGSFSEREREREREFEIVGNRRPAQAPEFSASSESPVLADNAILQVNRYIFIGVLFVFRHSIDSHWQPADQTGYDQAISVQPPGQSAIMAFN